jgi:hypothetical protein
MIPHDAIPYLLSNFPRSKKNENKIHRGAKLRTAEKNRTSDLNSNELNNVMHSIFTKKSRNFQSFQKIRKLLGFEIL